MLYITILNFTFTYYNDLLNIAKKLKIDFRIYGRCIYKNIRQEQQLKQ
jgi:hypothetical protein